MMATMKREPAKLPQKVTNQCINIFQTERRRWRTEIVVICTHQSPTVCLLVSGELTMKDPVQRSVPVTMTRVSPKGKTSAASVRMSPGAFSWNQGAVLVLSNTAQANDKSMPAITELKNILSSLMFALATPARPMSSTVSLGEYALTGRGISVAAIVDTFGSRDHTDYIDVLLHCGQDFRKSNLFGKSEAQERKVIVGTKQIFHMPERHHCLLYT